MEKLSKELKKNIEKLGYTDFTEIQAKVVPEVLLGNDVLGQSYTGSGKTASFLIPLIEIIDPEDPKQKIIIAPTRELALQISQELAGLTKGMGVKSVIVVGGEPQQPQKRALKSGVQFIIGTPGRIMDLINQRAIKVTGIDTVVLDEVDELLNMGFLEDLELILSKLPRDRQNLFFSATINPKIKKLCEKHSKELIVINTNSKSQVKNKNVEQKYVVAKQGEKNDLLAKLLMLNTAEKSIVFVRTKRSADEVKSYLQREGFSVDTIHGDLTQQTRTKIYHNFKTGSLKILVATDVAARGIHIDNLEFVYNYDIPENKEYYTHRIGRTGRAGNKGTAISFVTPKEKRFFASKFLEKSEKAIEITGPSKKEIADSMLDNLVSQMDAVRSDSSSKIDDKLIAQLYAKYFNEQEIIDVLVNYILKKEKIQTGGGR
jgi:ATP-dependent RNA helicase DeaD